jgi:hypothetical protein
VLKGMKPAALKAVRAAARQGRSVVVDTIKQTKPFPPVDRGAYRASWQVENTEDGAILFSDAPHAAFIEYGTRPHMPPLLPILRWVQRKRLAGKRRPRGEDAARSRARQELAIANAIRITIAKRGTKPLKVLERSLPEITKILNAEIDKALREAIG